MPSATFSLAEIIENPDLLKISALPWLPLEERSAFPQKRAIYFAIDASNRIHYIGIAENPKTRWSNHHKFPELSKIVGVKIAYFFVNTFDPLRPAETALIKHFQPPLNIAGNPLVVAQRQSDRAAPVVQSGISIAIYKPIKTPFGAFTQVFTFEVPNLGFSIRSLRVASGRTVKDISRAAGISEKRWAKIESQTILEAISRADLRKIETALGADLESTLPPDFAKVNTPFTASPHADRVVLAASVRAQEVKAPKQKSKSPKREDRQLSLFS